MLFAALLLLAVAPDALGLPPAAGPSRAYGWFAAPPPERDRVLVVGDPTARRPWFSGIRRLGTVDAVPPPVLGVLLPPHPPIWLMSGR